MALWKRLANVFRGGAVDREIDEELQSHLEEALEHGRDPREVHRAFGSALRLREESHDVRVVGWLDHLRADVLFGARQLWKNRTGTAAAVLSLALAVGACTAAFRLVDALLLRPLPVAEAQSLYVVAYESYGREQVAEEATSFSYPAFRELGEALQGKAQLMAISYAYPVDLSFGSEQEMEQAYRQYVSGSVMSTLGLRPRLGRLLGESDNQKPGGHPVAVLSHEYWQRRFGADPGIVGRRFQMGEVSYEVVGVLEAGFTGTEPGVFVDIYVPTMMNSRAVESPNWHWFRTWVRVPANESREAVRAQLHAAYTRFRAERAKGFGEGATPEEIARYVNAPVSLVPASAGYSSMQNTYKRSLWILAALVAMVLLIACANVANLLTAQATGRAREMALRVSIGAGRRRLVQLVMVESALLALAATVLGAMFAWWAAPTVVSMINPADTPARLVLSGDWRFFSFLAALTALVTVLFGLAPALRASWVNPADTLKAGLHPHAGRRMMHAMIAAQVAFCFLVHFVAGLFVSTFDRLAHQSPGFSTERLLVLDVVSKEERAPAEWMALVERLRAVPGVESAAVSQDALMANSQWVSSVWANGRGPDTVEGPYFLGISPGWMELMKIPLLSGRDLAEGERADRSALVNEAFAREFFDGADPTGRTFEVGAGRNKRTLVTIVGMVKDARYDDMRERIRPTVYVPLLQPENEEGKEGSMRRMSYAALLLRTANPQALTMAATLRQEVAGTDGRFRVRNVRTQQAMVEAKTLRERMLAVLSLFFATVALLLAAVGLYGVLDYSVVQLRFDLGIRLALGAQPDRIVRRVTREVLAMLLLGSVVGLVAGVASERYLETLLYQVRATDPALLLLPLLTIFGAAALAAMPPVLRALRIDPASMLRAD